jgi:phosphatidylglycerophosphate synthase
MAEAAASVRGLLEQLRLHQKQFDITEVFFHRKVSPYCSAVFLRLGVSANAITGLWGALNVVGSIFVYWALTRHPAFVLLVPIVHNISEVFDCADGEVARISGKSSPIGGKLLDGLSHKATEFSLLAAFVMGAWQLVPEWYVVAIALLLLAGEGMIGYTYERRLLVLRVHAQFQGRATEMAPDDLYERGDTWWSFGNRKKLKTIEGFIHYKSVYLVVALAQFSATALVAGLGVIAIYKHVDWLRLAYRTVSRPPQMASND